MEVGAVVGAAPKANVVRKAPCPGDIVVLIGGATGRDGVGGATGSSKEHNDTSLTKCSSEVQKEMHQLNVNCSVYSVIQTPLV